jgi:hypothetical protein
LDARNDVVGNSPRLSFISDCTSVDTGPCISFFDGVLPSGELFNVKCGQLDLVDDFGTSVIELARHSVATQHMNTRAGFLRVTKTSWRD